MDRLPITKAGYERLKLVLRQMQTHDRREVATEIEIARAHGDLRENADYDAAKEKQGMLEATIRDLEDKVARAQIIDVSGLSGDRVVFGATVTLLDLDTDKAQVLTIVGEAEADLSRGLISVGSPFARGLIGKYVDDEVTIVVPGGKRQVEITDVSFGAV